MLLATYVHTYHFAPVLKLAFLLRADEGRRHLVTAASEHDDDHDKVQNMYAYERLVIIIFIIVYTIVYFRVCFVCILQFQDSIT